MSNKLTTTSTSWGTPASPYRVLLVEDDEADAKLTRRLLEDSETAFTVMGARSVAEANNVLARSRVDAVLADLVLPDGEGTELLGEDGGGPVFVLSAQGDEDHAVAALKAGAADYVVKATSRYRELPQLVVRAIEEWRLRQEHREALSRLKASEERLRVLFDVSPDLLAMAHANGTFFWTNPAWRAVFGRDLNRQLSPLALVSPDEIGRVGEAWRGLTKHGVPIKRLACRLRLESGRYHDFEINAQPVRLGGERNFFIAAHEVTELKSVERQLRQRNDELTGLFETSRAIAYSPDLDAVLAELLSFAREALGTEYVSVVLGDDAGEPQLTLGTDPHSGPAISERAREHGITREVLRGGKPLIFDEVEPNGRHSAALVESGVRSYAAIPMRADKRVVGVLFAHSRSPRQFSDRRRLLITIANQAAQAVRDAKLLEEVWAQEERLATLSKRLVEVQEEERRRLAHELHDEIGQTMTAVRVALQRAESATDAETARTRLGEAQEMVERVLTDVRGLSLDLRPPMLDDLGLGATLKWYLERQQELTGLEIQFDGAEAVLDLAPAQTIACFRVVQEALTNAVRHANATTVRVTLDHSPSGVTVEVRDDGDGFDVATARVAAVHGKSAGLIGMEERLRLLGGQLRLESIPGEGTAVVAVLPAAVLGKGQDE